jgi:histidine triad (HIT) family protein
MSAAPAPAPARTPAHPFDPTAIFPAAGPGAFALAAREAAYRSAGCIFCDIVHGAKPCHKLYEDEHVMAFLDVRPLGRGHTLLIPKAHYQTADAAEPEALAACMRALPRVSRALLGELKYTGFTLMQNNGGVSGQEVPHVHFHVVPRCEGDTLSAMRSIYAKSTSIAGRYSDPAAFAAAVAQRVALDPAAGASSSGDRDGRGGINSAPADAAAPVATAAHGGAGRPDQ